MRKFIILFLSFLFFSSSVMAFNEKNMPENYPMCFDSDIYPKTFCPLVGKLGHKLILVDFTSRWNNSQVDRIKGRIFGTTIEENTAPYHMISYLKMDVTEPNSQKFTVCGGFSPKTHMIRKMYTQLDLVDFLSKRSNFFGGGP